MRLYFILLLFTLFSCTGKGKFDNSKISHPNHVYSFVSIDSSTLQYTETDYVPIYSEIYHMNVSRKMLLTSTLSIRNTSLSDSAYITKADYYDSYGKKLRSYIDSAILLKPLESIEFVVEYEEEKGGAGANFIVDWGARKYTNQILLQSIMIGTSGQQGISFTSDSKIIKQNSK